jgi:FkbM family methyltransferase
VFLLNLLKLDNILRNIILRFLPENIIKIYRNYKNPDKFRREVEIERLKLIPRFNSGISNLLEKPVAFIDSASFLFIQDELFNKEIYKFKSDIPNPLIIDAGANIGLSVIYFKTLYPKSEIIAFEPDSKAFEVLKKNIKTYNFEKVKLIKKALWNEETTLKFYSEGADGGRNALPSDKENIINVEAIRLRNYLNNKVDFLKIDIEGAEYTVIKDCQDLLINVKLIFVEYHSFISGEQYLAELLTILKNAGFKVHVTAPSLVANQPFMDLPNYSNMDNQLNIYGIRK